MGVITTVRLPEGTTFGPVPPSVTLADPIVLIGHRTSDTPPDIHTVKLDLASFSSGLMHLIEWVPYVQAARDPIEQNMEATIDDVDHQLYFRVTRSVPANGELLIWYSDKLAARIGVPEIKEDFIRDGVFHCPSCNELFTYPNCLRAHLRFRCKYRQQQQQLQQVHQLVPGITPGHVITTSYGQSPITALANIREAAIALEAASLARQSAAYEDSRLHDGTGGSPSGSVEEPSRNYNRSIPDFGEARHRASSGDRKSIGSSDGTISPREVGDRRSSSGAVKRRRHEDASSEETLTTSAGSTGTQSKISRSSFSPLTCKTEGESSSDESDAVAKNHSTFEASASAFHQVNRASPTLTTSSLGAIVTRCGSIGSTSPAGSLSVTPPARPFSSELLPTSLLNTSSTLDLAAPDKASVVAAATAAMMSGMFLFPQLAAARAAAAAAAVAALPLGMQHHHSDRFRAVAQLPVGLPPTSMHSTSSSSWTNGLGMNNNNNNINNNIISNLTKNNVNKLASVQGIFSQSYDIHAQHQIPNRLGPAQHPSLPFVYRSPNPMVVDKMLHMFGSSSSPHSPTPTSVASHHHLGHSQQPPPSTPHIQTGSAVSGPLQSTMMSLNLSQNWCAKCNTSFRMTSDLVYHMRSHHKRDFDPVKRRKDDKLRCDVCGETFRERHHLTRHMTSHS